MATEPHEHLTPWLEESFPIVDAACTRWLKRRAELHRRAAAKNEPPDILPAAFPDAADGAGAGER